MVPLLPNAIQELRASRMGVRAMKALKAGNLTKCIELNLKALELMEQTYGNIPQTIVYAWNLAEAYKLHGQLRDAESCYRRVLRYLESHSAPELAYSFNRTSVIDGLSDVLRRQGRIDEASQLSEEVQQPISKFEESSINTQADLDTFVENYYRTKANDKISSAMYFLDKVSEIPVENLSSAVAGFYSEVFRANPERLNDWIKEINNFSERGRELFRNALWISGTLKAKEHIEKNAEEVGDEINISARSMIESQPPDLRSMVPDNPEEMDMSWGAFLATGDPVFVTNIIAASTKYNERENYYIFTTAAVGKWSLVLNAQEHEIVYRTLEDELGKYDGKEKQIIQDIMEKSKSSSGATTVNEETRKILRAQKRKGRWL